MRSVKTKRGAVRRYNAIMAKCYKDAKGGLKFGLDWPTLGILWPDRYCELREIMAGYDNLPA